MTSEICVAPTFLKENHNNLKHQSEFSSVWQVDVVRERLFINEKTEDLLCQTFPSLTLDNIARLVPKGKS